MSITRAVKSISDRTKSVRERIVGAEKYLRNVRSGTGYAINSIGMI